MRYKFNNSFDTPEYLAKRKQEQLEAIKKRKMGLTPDFRQVPDTKPEGVAAGHRSQAIKLRNKNRKVTLPSI